MSKVSPSYDREPSVPSPQESTHGAGLIPLCSIFLSDVSPKELVIKFPDPPKVRGLVNIKQLMKQ